MYAFIPWMDNRALLFLLFPIFPNFPPQHLLLVIFDFVSVFDFAIYFALDDYKSKLGCEEWLFKIWFMK